MPTEKEIQDLIDNYEYLHVVLDSVGVPPKTRSGTDMTVLMRMQVLHDCFRRMKKK
jgi:hypothetical protein